MIKITTPKRIKFQYPEKNKSNKKMRRNLTSILLILLINSMDARTIQILEDDSNGKYTDFNTTGVHVIFTNPIEWAWDDYRKTTIVAVLIMLVSLSLNFFFYLRYLLDLAPVNWRHQRVVRLQPTFEGDL